MNNQTPIEHQTNQIFMLYSESKQKFIHITGVQVNYINCMALASVYECRKDAIATKEAVCKIGQIEPSEIILLQVVEG